MYARFIVSCAFATAFVISTPEIVDRLFIETAGRTDARFNEEVVEDEEVALGMEMAENNSKKLIFFCS